MTPQQFYRGSIALPFLGMIPALALGLVSKWEVHDPILRFLSQLSAALLFVGIFAGVPYALYVAIVWKFFRPETESSHRRVALFAPVIVGGAFIGISILGQLASRAPSLSDFAYAVLVPGVLAVGFGYFNVGLIELSLLVAKRFGWGRSDSAGLA